MSACGLTKLTWLYLVFLFISIQCYLAKTLFESFLIDSTGLNPQKFETICPALVEQIESKACLLESDKEEEEYGKQSKAQGKSHNIFRFTNLLQQVSMMEKDHFMEQATCRWLGQAEDPW